MANGSAFVKAVFKNVPLIGFSFLSKDIKKEVYASITKSINVICIGIKGNSILVNIQNTDNSTEYMVLMKNILATFVMLLTTRLPSINTSFNTLKSEFKSTI